MAVQALPNVCPEGFCRPPLPLSRLKPLLDKDPVLRFDCRFVDHSQAAISLPEPRVRAGPPWPWLLIAGLLAVHLALVPYAQGAGSERQSLSFFVWAYANTTDWQHCLLVPPLVAWLIWRKRPLLTSAPPRPDAILGGLALGLAELLYWTGYRADNYYLGYASIQLLAAALVLWFFGRRIFGLIAFPWAFLLFAWPLLFLDNLVAFPLRMIMATASTALLNLIGIETLQNGTALLSAPNPPLGIPAGRVFSLDVADPCSGIRSLFALTMLAALYAHLSQRTLLKQFALFLSAFPLAVIGNMARVTTIAIVAVAFSQGFAAGPYHDFSGYLVFIVAIGLMLAFGTLLRHGVRNTARAIFHPILAWRSHTRSQPHPEPGPTQAY